MDHWDMPTVYRDQCRFCTSRLCFWRVFTDDRRFDEVACRDHRGLLERLADWSLKGAIRHNVTSSARVSRDRMPPEQPRDGGPS